MQLARNAVIACIAAMLLASSGSLLNAREAFAPQKSDSVVLAKYGINDIPKKDRKRFWDAIEDLALLDVVVELCEKRRLRYDAKLRREVKSCVDPKSMRRVQSYFNKRRAHYSRTATTYACKNDKFMQSVQRFRTAVDEGLNKLGSACSLCFFC